MHQSSMDRMIDFKTKYLSDRVNDPLVILDLGSLDVNGSYRPLFDHPAWTYTGLDLTPGNNVDVVLQDPYRWREIKSNSADVVISGQAFEHIEYIWITILEIERVLKPGGICCIIAPSGGSEHRYPVDCWRFYPDGFNALARFAKLEVKKIYINWEHDDRYKDHSNEWRDAMLVCRKLKLSRFYAWRHNMWRGLMHKVLTSRLA